MTPILSAGFASLVSDENVTLDVNKTILKEGIVALQTFIEEVKITEVRIVKKSF